MFTSVNMSNFVPSKSHLRLSLLFLFHQKKKAVEAHRLLVETYGEHGQWNPPEKHDRVCSAPMRFLLALPVVPIPTPIKLSLLHHKCDKWLDERPELLKLEHERDHRVRSKLSTHCLTKGLPCHTPFCADEECVPCGIHRKIAVATHLLVSLLKALQLRVKTAMAWERLCQIKTNFPVLSAQPGGELRD